MFPAVRITLRSNRCVLDRTMTAYGSSLGNVLVQFLSWSPHLIPPLPTAVAAAFSFTSRPKFFVAVRSAGANCNTHTTHEEIERVTGTPRGMPRPHSSRGTGRHDFGDLDRRPSRSPRGVPNPADIRLADQNTCKTRKSPGQSDHITGLQERRPPQASLRPLRTELPLSLRRKSAAGCFPQPTKPRTPRVDSTGNRNRISRRANKYQRNAANRDSEVLSRHFRIMFWKAVKAS